MGHRSLRRACLLAATLAAACLPAAPAGAWEPRVSEDFYGISAPNLYTLSGEGRTAELDRHLAQIKGAGLDWVRAEIGWADAEPTAPVAGAHAYDWRLADRFVAALARRELTLAPMLMGTPHWARSPVAVAAGCGRSAGPSPLAAPDYGEFARAVVRRYGRGGAFWSERPELSPQPIEQVELFNEPNWAGFWCPAPDPATFALLVEAAGRAAHAVDPDIRVVAGGLVAVKPGDDSVLRNLGLDVDAFLGGMLAAVPGLGSHVDAVGLHLYHPDPDVDLGLVGWFRTRLEAAGLGNAEIVVNEFGWRTSGGGTDPVSEAARAALFSELTGQYARTDCGVAGVSAHTWITPETNHDDPEHWYGIADPSSGELYASGRAYRDEVALYEGRGPTPAPRETLHICGEPPPDSDGDGTPDEGDDYPTDPDRSSGSGEVPPAPPAPPEPTNPPRIEPGFFGISLADLPWELEPRRLHLDSMRDARVGRVRATVQWAHLQPRADGAIDWTETDTLTLQLAKRGIQMVPHVGRPPTWATSDPSAWQAPYLDLLAAYARRYGPGGSFWAENGQLDPALAQDRVEVTPVGNSQTHWWGGTLTAAAYADLYAAARTRLRAASPEIQAIASFYDEGDRGPAASFVAAMHSARPSLAGTLDGAHVYGNAPSIARLEETVAAVRAALDATGNPSSALHVGFGWSTVGPDALSEAARADRMGHVISRLARSNCGVEAVYPHAWSTAERTSTNPWEWYGMAAPADGALRATGLAYAAQAAAYLGFAPPPPREAVKLCGAGEPDRDGDGTPDSRDDFPLDPARFDGTAPSLAIAVRPKGDGATTRVAVSVTDVSPIARQRCRLDGRAWQACGSSVTYRRLGPGRHIVAVEAVDGHGNRSLSSRRWRVRR